MGRRRREGEGGSEDLEEIAHSMTPLVVVRGRIELPT